MAAVCTNTLVTPILHTTAAMRKKTLFDRSHKTSCYLYVLSFLSYNCKINKCKCKFIPPHLYFISKTDSTSIFQDKWQEKRLEWPKQFISKHFSTVHKCDKWTPRQKKRTLIQHMPCFAMAIKCKSTN